MTEPSSNPLLPAPDARIKTYEAFMGAQADLFQQQKELSKLQKKMKAYTGEEDVSTLQNDQLLLSTQENLLIIQRTDCMSGYLELCLRAAFPDSQAEKEAEDFAFRQRELLMETALNTEYISKNHINLSDTSIKLCHIIKEITQTKNNAIGSHPLSFFIKLLNEPPTRMANQPDISP